MAIPGNKKETFQLRLTKELKTRLADAAREQGVTQTWFWEDALLQKLRGIEEAKQSKQA